MWSADGAEIFYWSNAGMTAVKVSYEPVFEFSHANLLFTLTPYVGEPGRHFDVTPNGRRFILVKHVSRGAAEMVVERNWLAELGSK